MNEPLPAEIAVAIRAHIEQHIGCLDAQFSRTAAEGIELLHVAPTDTRPLHAFITSGMSAHPMSLPADSGSSAYVELMISLPNDWQIGNPDDAWQWPLQQLTKIAALPRMNGTAIRWGLMIPNGDPPAPLGPGTKQAGAIVAPSLMVPARFYELEAADRSIVFLSVIPLYRAELELGATQGMEAVLSRLVDHDVNDVIDPRRRDVTKRFFGLF